MQLVTRKNAHGEIERQLQSSEYGDLLLEVQHREPALKRFRDWAAVLKLMNGKHSTSQNEVITALIREHKRDRRWNTILLAVFWPYLDAIFQAKSTWDTEPDELWQNILLIFFEVVRRPGTASAHHNVIRKITNGTRHRLHDLYRRRWRKINIEVAVEPTFLNDLIGDSVCTRLQTINMFDEISGEQRRLKLHCLQKRITPRQAHLLLFTRVIGARLIDYCRHIDLNYQLAKKWRQRAEAALRKCEIV